MKKIVLMLVIITSSLNAFGQIDTTRKEFFPLHIGDIWQYRDERNILFTHRIIGDTIIDGQRYFLLYHTLRTSGGGITRIDSLSRVVNYGYGKNSPIYRLSEKDNTVWPIEETFWGLITPQPLVRFNGITISSVFGAQREIMHFDFGGTMSVGPYDTVWGFGGLLARGIGVIQERYYEGEYYTLQGAIIDSIQYGTIVSVGELSETIPKQIALCQNYPNPFNPSTIIQYQLPNAGYATLKVYDMLGREVATLVNGAKETGYYTTTFDGSRLSSGFYFVRFTAQSADGAALFTKTIKILLTK